MTLQFKSMKWILPALLFAAWPCVAEQAKPQPLARAHAHNDYYHERPLLDALASGFCSVEADVFLKDDTLLVGHSRFELKKERTLESLYLAPLAKRVKANGGSVYKTKAPFHLMIDFKTDGPRDLHCAQAVAREIPLHAHRVHLRHNPARRGDNCHLRQPAARGDGKRHRAPRRLRRAIG